MCRMMRLVRNRTRLAAFAECNCRSHISDSSQNESKYLPLSTNIELERIRGIEVI